MTKKTTTYIFILAGLAALSVWLLRGACLSFFRWYLVLILIGIGFYPLTAVLFDSFEDHGWIFSRSLAIMACGYVTWLFVTGGLQQFTSRRCLVITLILSGICWSRFMGRPQKTRPRTELILGEEVLFFAALLIWTWFFCFRPEAYGTEKFMDYGLLVSMERSLQIPARDMWYGLGDVNYYYGGQYYTVFLSKLSALPVRYTYNLMRAAVAAFAFTIPFSLVYHLLQNRLQELKTQRIWSLAGGLAAGCAVSLAGNVHYVLYGLFGNLFRLEGYEDYWFPSSTRYIGHNPPVAGDQCIHEFPSYSFVLGDLHAHMLNIIFVLTILGLLYCWVRKVRMLELDRLERERIRQEQQLHRPSKYTGKKSLRIFLRRNGLEAPLLLAGVIVGICKWTNYWDFIIYFTVTVFVCILVALYRYQNNLMRVAGSVLLHVAEVWVLTELIPLPFIMRFENTVSGIGAAVYHTAPYQLAILWGLPVAVFILLLVLVIRQFAGRYNADPSFAADEKCGPVFSFFRHAPQSDRFVLVLGLCACGLILIPELVYVRDIYEDGFSRANTMFKLTYQAFILFGILIGYGLIRILAEERKQLVRILNGFLLVVFVLTIGYFPYAVSCWFGNVLDRNRFQGLDATAFIYSRYPEDAAAIDWLRTYVSGQPIVLEASGDSYSDYCRVSAMTGLPTLEGWYVHEWLWRGNTTDLDAKNEDIRAIYEAEDPYDAERLMAHYGIAYLFVGSCEHEKYTIDDTVLQQTGEVIFREGDTYIVQFLTGDDNGSI